MLFSDLSDLQPGVRWRITFVAALVLGLLALLILGASAASGSKGQSAMAAVLLAGASCAVGAFLGFLFGIPRSQQVSAEALKKTGMKHYQENTNLEQISDWLTKIIVGLTLVQYQKIIELLQNIGASFGPALLVNHTPAVQSGVVIAIVLYFLIITFMFIYLWTRIYVEYIFKKQGILFDSELETLLQNREESKNNLDAQALELTDEFLDDSASPKDPMFLEIEKVIAKSSLIARTLIFERAARARKAAWTSDDPITTAKTVRVFQGLIKAEPDRHHRNYGQLGYAVIRTEEPDWSLAKQSLEKAIKLRGEDNQTSGMGYYEFNLAIAEIQLDEGFIERKASSSAVQSRILKLLSKGKRVIPSLDEPVIQDWLKLNEKSG